MFLFLFLFCISQYFQWIFFWLINFHCFWNQWNIVFSTRKARSEKTLSNICWHSLLFRGLEFKFSRQSIFFSVSLAHVQRNQNTMHMPIILVHTISVLFSAWLFSRDVTVQILARSKCVIYLRGPVFTRRVWSIVRLICMNNSLFDRRNHFKCVFSVAGFDAYSTARSLIIITTKYQIHEKSPTATAHTMNMLNKYFSSLFFFSSPIHLCINRRWLCLFGVSLWLPLLSSPSLHSLSGLTLSSLTVCVCVRCAPLSFSASLSMYCVYIWICGAYRLLPLLLLLLLLWVHATGHALPTMNVKTRMRARAIDRERVK